MTFSKQVLPVALILAALWLLLSSQTTYAAGPTCTVDESGGANFTTISAAVTDTGCTTIQVAAGVYVENVVIDRSLSIVGAGPRATTVDGNGAGAVFTAFSGAVSLSGLTITGGNNPEGGGGGIANNSTMTVSDAIIINNSAGVGGGISTDIGSMTVNNSTIVSNTAIYGGGIYNNTDSTLLVKYSAIISNTAIRQDVGASEGGGIFNNSGSVTVSNSTISDNSAEDSGGAIINFANLTVSASTISGNRAENGGGITIYNNGVLTLSNSIIANSLLGIDCYNSPFSENINSLIDRGYNLVEDSSCFSGGTNLSGDPQLAPLANNGGPTPTHALLAGSPARDVIANGVNGCGATLTTDQRSFPRPANGKCDIGAFEFAIANLSLFIPFLAR